MVRNSRHIRFPIRRRKRRVEIDHDHAIHPAVAFANLVEHRIGHVAREIVEVSDVRVREDDGGFGYLPSVSALCGAHAYVHMSSLARTIADTAVKMSNGTVTVMASRFQNGDGTINTARGG